VLAPGPKPCPARSSYLRTRAGLYDPVAADFRGPKFDSSLDHNAAFGFYLDTGKVIKGWDDGISGMKIGGKRTLAVPPGMAYGTSGSSVIPPNATLLFDIELIDVRVSRSGGEK
jgi:FKBP-type peptidyl-prolyl cis-trans isomerase FkpA